MNINGHWYTETEAQAYIITLEHKNAALEDKHLSECRQISEYDHELRQAKRLLKAAVEDFTAIAEVRAVATPILCPKYYEAYMKAIDVRIRKWRYANEALALIGEEGGNNGSTSIRRYMDMIGGKSDD